MRRFINGLLIGFLLGAATLWFLQRPPAPGPAGTASGPSAPGPEPEAAAPAPAGSGISTQTREDLGEVVYRRSCSVCHSLRPPPVQGPPIVGLAMHYHQAFDDPEAAVEHMVAFVQSPTAGQSRVEPQAIERWGLMPAIQLSQGELRAVARWIWAQQDPDFVPPAGH